MEQGTQHRRRCSPSSFTLVLSLLVALLWTATPALAWGSVGHEIVATIAQTQLHPDVRAKLCDILPRNRTAYHSAYPSSGEESHHGETHCHLAPLAAWPDVVKRHIPWSSHLHYINPVGDLPPQHCAYGEKGWADHGTGNVLEAIVNYTSQVASGTGAERDLALRFLTHYIGDLHQPLHLTGRSRGGNDISVRFEGRYARLHTVWDSQMLNKQIRELSNYTTPLPSARIESALLGRSYDAYVRWILAEGLGQGRPPTESPEQAWFHGQDDAWLECPEISPRVKSRKTGERSLAQRFAPRSMFLATRIHNFIQRRASAPAPIDPGAVDDTEQPVCPYYWSKPMHTLVCKYAFAKPVPGPDAARNGHVQPELDVPEYTGRIEAGHVLQKQLAMAGLRLAGILNTLLLPEENAAALALDDMPRVEHVKIVEDEPKHGKHGGHHKAKSDRSPIWSLVLVTTESIAEVIILSSVGYILARQGILDKGTQTKINKVNVSFFTPSLLFSKVAFTLDPARLAELIIVPAGFVIVTVTSALVAWLLSKVARITKAQRNFSIACAITPNSNSLPVALMQSLVATVPQLHWEEDGEPEDTVNGMLGRALTYLVLFSTLGMFLRWSLGAKLLSTMDDADEKEDPVTGTHAKRDARIRDGEQRTDGGESSTEEGLQVHVRGPSGEDVTGQPRGHMRRSNSNRNWVYSFPNSPHHDTASDSNSYDDEQRSLLGRNGDDGDGARSPRQVRSTSAFEAIMKPLRAIGRFMTVPLYAALLSLIVAMLPPVQRLLGGIEPLVGAIETAGACSIPLTMVVLGAYFYSEPEKPPAAGDQPKPSSDAATANASGTDYDNGTLVERAANGQRKDQPVHRRGTASGSSEETQALTADRSFDSGREESDNLISGNEVSQRQEQQAARKTSLERRTIAVAVLSRMFVTPMILLPAVAWYAIATRYNVMDDPVFITCACLLIGSPPALTLAQITSQSAKGGDGGFERLISKTIFVSYAILATPTTIVLVLTALLVAENDH